MITTNFNYHGEVFVFDLDDTLMSERDYVRSGFKLIESELRKEYGDEAEGLYEKLNSLLEERASYFDFLERWLGERNAPAGKLKSLIDSYRSHIPEKLELRPGVEDVLETLSNRGVVIGIITDGRSVTQRAKMRALGIERFFDPRNILISEETGFDKTTPHNFRKFVSRYPEARRFIYVGDNERKDFIMPSLLGWSTLKAPYDSDNVHENFENPDKLSRPDVILTSFEEIISKI